MQHARGNAAQLRVCVVGGSGFIGSHVADELSAAGHHVRIFDHRASPWISGDQEMFVGSTDSMDDLAHAVDGCQAVYHFAGLSNLDAARADPLAAAQQNVMGSVRLLEACQRAGVRRFLYASTMYVYSRHGGFYRVSKQAAELFVEEFGRATGMEFVILRFGSIYGPRSDETNGLYRLVRSALRSRQVSYAGSPEAIREYVHVRDVAGSCVEALSERFRDRCVVITGRESTPVRDLALMLTEMLGLPDGAIEFTLGASPGHYTRTPYSDMSPVAQKYSPEMHVDLGQGLLQLIDYVRSREQELSDQ